MGIKVAKEARAGERGEGMGVDGTDTATYYISWLINHIVKYTNKRPHDEKAGAWRPGEAGMNHDPLSELFAALADPTRRAILARLSKGEATVNELAEPFDITLPAISRHLKVLERAGLIERTRDAQYRPCRLQAAPLKDVADWIGYYRQYWEESFDRLDAYLKTVTSRQKKKRGKKDGRHS